MPTSAPRPRARDLGVAPGVFAPGAKNAITDVAGVRVGQVTVPPGARVINARGKFVLPGLWDSQVAYSWYFGEALLNHGITSTIDVGTEAETAVPHRDSVLHGKVLAPRAFTASCASGPR